MKHIFIRVILVILFITSLVYVKDYASISTSPGYDRPGLAGAAAAWGIIAAFCVWSFIYFECNYRKPKDQDNNK